MKIEPVGFIPTFSLTGSLYERLEMFDKATLRQDAVGSPHKDTRSIFLRGPEFPVEDWFRDVRQIDYLDWIATWPEARCMLDLVEEVLDRKLGKAMLVELRKGGTIAWHRDEGAYAAQHQRFHVALVTNPGCFLFCGDEQAHLPVGVLTRVDVSHLHSAINVGTTPRIHLIFDVRKD